MRYFHYASYGIALLGMSASVLLGIAVYRLTQERQTLTESLKTASLDKGDLLVRLQDAEDRVQSDEQELQGQADFIRALREQLASSTDLGQLAYMVRGATEVAGDLKKLSETDTELLAKYSKIYFLNEHYVPTNLAVIDSMWTNEQGAQLKSEVLPHLYAMFSAMHNAGLTPRIVSAYRSYGYQSAVKAQYQVVYGSGANTFSADQGYSEHQLGTVVDITHNSDTLARSFRDTQEYAWLTEHAYEYGFVLSYPEGNTYYTFEPWHWRYVGVRLATDLHDKQEYFYDMPQREIGNYLLDIFNE